jgi:RNA polymerase-interacting CarD/CdnL/TRCF family regulator
MELDLTTDILSFNQRVTQQAAALEKTVLLEVAAFSNELAKEEKKRAESDRQLLTQVNEFLLGLQNPSTEIENFSARSLQKAA